MWPSPFYDAIFLTEMEWKIFLKNPLVGEGKVSSKANIPSLWSWNFTFFSIVERENIHNFYKHTQKTCIS